MPEDVVWEWTNGDTAEMLANIAGDLVGLLGLVAVFLLGLGLIARIGR